MYSYGWPARASLSQAVSPRKRSIENDETRHLEKMQKQLDHMEYCKGAAERSAMVLDCVMKKHEKMFLVFRFTLQQVFRKQVSASHLLAINRVDSRLALIL